MRLETEISNLIWTGASIVLLWAVIKWFAIPTVVDCMRQRLFKVRREMFLYMAGGGISADHPAYGYIRNSINLAIRYAESISLSRALIGAAVAGKFGAEQIRDAEAAIALLPKDIRDQIEGFRERAAVIVGIYAIVRSPVGWALVCILTPVLLAAYVFSFFQDMGTRILMSAMQAVTRRAEQETHILQCLDEDGLVRVAA